jgi:PRTRC genetic system ThiF family protein
MKVFAFDGIWQLDHIVIVGVGGTGSALARLVARMLWQRGAMGQSVPTLHLIDPDVVEMKNVIRQGFAPAEVGMFKSQAIAVRHSLIYGLPIHYATQTFDPDQPVPPGSILVDCTDNHLARRSILKAFDCGTTKTILHCGNAKTHAQVILGTCGDREQLEAEIQRMENTEASYRNGIFRPCHALPHFGLIYPELLEPEPPGPDPAPDLSCAELALTEEQHPLINENVALVAAGYLYKLLHREPITTFMTELDSHNNVTTSRRVDPVVLRAAISPP